MKSDRSSIIEMTDEILFRRGTTLVRRQWLAPGEVLPWHHDPFHRVSVVLSGDQIRKSINMIFQHEFTLVVAGAFTCLQELQRKPNGRVSGPTYFFRDCRKKRRDAEGHRQPKRGRAGSHWRA